MYAFAAFVKAKKYEDARQLLEHRYVAPTTIGGSDLEGYDFRNFNTHASLEQMCAVRGGQRVSNVIAGLVHDRATNRHIRFSDVVQADVVLWIASNGYGWPPRCFICGRSVGKLELFVRAVTSAGFAPLKTLLNLESPQVLLKWLSSEQVINTLRADRFLFAEQCLNLEELQRRWGSVEPS